MKLRQKLVSNSSSSSFFVNVEKLTPAQKAIVTNYKMLSILMEGEIIDENLLWTEEKDGVVEIFIYMDNGEIPKILDNLEIKWRCW